jgi:hypothetical protein
MRTFILHYFIYSFSILLILYGLFTIYDHNLIKGFLIGIFCLMICRCNYTGLVCRMFDEEDPLMVPPPTPPHEIEMEELNQV